MFVPNKSIPLKETILYKSTQILAVLDDEMDLNILYKNVNRKFENIIEFIDALDLLFILGAINIDIENGVIIKC